MPQCPTPLLGRDILTKFQASISFNLRPIPLLVLMTTDGHSDSTGQILPSGVDRKVWDIDTPSLATCPPIKILLQDPHHFLCQPQYSLPTSSLLGLQPVITGLLHKGLLRPTHSPYNSPILAVKKPNGTYHLSKILDSLIMLLNLYIPSSLTLTPFSLLFLPPPLTFLSLISRMPFLPSPSPPSHRTFLPLPGWTHTHHSQQLTWTVLPQGFRDSPQLFEQALAKDLRDLCLSKSTLLQYVDDLLLCSPSPDISQTDTTLLLNFLADKGYQASLRKAQLSQVTVTYLGVQLSHDSKAITLDRK
jgi:hypothetical protein